MFQKLKTLFTNLTIYGMGDVATSIVSFLLLPIFVRFLSKVDYGIWALLLMVELVAKIVFRWGIDASFMRLYYDCETHGARQRLASTIFFFLFAVNGGLLVAALLSAPWMSDRLFGVPGQTPVLEIVLVNTFIGGFFFIPFHVLRIKQKARTFSGLTFFRSASTLIVRLVLVVGLHYGVLGLALADLVVTLAFTFMLMRWFAPLIRPVFSRPVLAEALRFGLPRVPHGVAQQVIGPGTDSYLLRLLLREPHAAALADIGVYSIGASFGLGLKLFLSAFEYAWAPFYFETMGQPDAKRTFSGMTTYSLAVLVLLAAGLSAVSGDLVRLMTRPDFYAASRVIPWIAMGVTLQGVYLLTSIGLNITKHTEYYPVAAGVAAAVNVGANVVLIPRLGILGPAWSNVISYAVLAGLSLCFSQRFYPIRYERARLAKVAGSGLACYFVAAHLLPPIHSAIAGLLVRGTVVAVGLPLLLALTGFFRAGELDRLRSTTAALRFGRAPKPGTVTAHVAGDAAGPIDTGLTGRTNVGD